MRQRIAVVLLCASAACAHGAQRPIPIPRPQAGIPSREAIIEAGRDQSYDPIPGASATTILEDSAKVTIEPQVGNYLVSEGQLRLGSVIARIRNHSSRAIPRLGLAPGGLTYWFVYNEKGEWKSALIADTKENRFDRLDVATRYHLEDRQWHQAISQWRYESASYRDKEAPGGGGVLALEEQSPWSTCTILGCCKLR